jgi:hypothetical protein
MVEEEKDIKQNRPNVFLVKLENVIFGTTDLQ